MFNKDEEWLLKEKYEGEKSTAFFADCHKLILGEPLAYLIGYIPFLDCKIWLDSQPLIPRPETEFWTEKAIKEIVTKMTGSENSPRILDLCAGSGCIGVAVAKHVPMALIDFGEINERHLLTIDKNLAENNIKPARSKIIQSDLFSNITDRYDFVLSNPPYIDPVLDRTEDSVKNFEPSEALYGGCLGLEFINQIVSGATKHLTPSGQLWIEHEPEQTASIHKIATASGFSITTHTDQYNIERYSILMLQ